MAQSVSIHNDVLRNQANVAKPNQPLVFSCVTRGSGILEWKSNEFIGTGNVLQLLSINCVGRNFSSSNNLAVGTCRNVTFDGVTEVIESELYIVASLQFPVSTITCRNNGVGTSEEISFNITEPPDVVVTTSLRENKVAVHQQSITFTCITRNTGILEWSCPEYIGEGIILQLLSVNCVGTNTSRKLAVATCKEIMDDFGIEVITAELYLEASVQFPTSTVTCTNNGRGSSALIQFQTVEQRDNEPETKTEPDVVTNTRKMDEITAVHNSTGGSATNIKITISISVVIIIVIIIFGILSTIIIFLTWRSKLKSEVVTSNNPTAVEVKTEKVQDNQNNINMTNAHSMTSSRTSSLSSQVRHGSCSMDGNTGNE